MTHICVSKLTIIGSDNGLSPDRRQAIIGTNAGLFLIGPLGANFSEILIKMLTFSLKKMRLKVSSAKRRPFCLGVNVLTHVFMAVLSLWWESLFAERARSKILTRDTPIARPSGRDLGCLLWVLSKICARVSRLFIQYFTKYHDISYRFIATLNCINIETSLKF